MGEERGQKGLGVGLLYDEGHAVLGDVIADHPAAKAGLAAGDVITSINGKDVATWFDIHRLLSETTAGQDISVGYTRSGQEQPGNAEAR